MFYHIVVTYDIVPEIPLKQQPEERPQVNSNHYNHLISFWAL
jgi:hypothetical protein